MKIKFILLALTISFLAYISSFLITDKPHNSKLEKSRSFMELPNTVKNAVLGNGHENYSPQNSTPELEKSDHVKIGEKLYSLAMTTGFYSGEKIKMLKIAKAHLAFAKKLEISSSPTVITNK